MGARFTTLLFSHLSHTHTHMHIYCRYTKCNEFIADLEEGRLQAQPGCSEEETLEVMLHHIFSIRLLVYVVLAYVQTVCFRQLF